MPMVRTDYGQVISKFSWMGSLLHFLTHGALLHALRARELRYYGLLLHCYSLAIDLLIVGSTISDYKKLSVNKAKLTSL